MPVNALAISVLALGVLLSAQDRPEWDGVDTLHNHQVLQRDASGRGALHLYGNAPGHWRGSIQIVVAGARTFRFRAGDIRLGKWTAEASLPTGGPYRVRIEARGANDLLLASRTVENVLVGDLWVLAGQSNMQGRGDLADVEPPTDLVHAFNLNEQWTVAREPLHQFATARDPVYRSKADLPGSGAGLGLSFARRVSEIAGVPVGLIPCALGGSSIARWNPEAKTDTSSLYAAMLRRVAASGGVVRGVLWYQGEADARDLQNSLKYAENLENLVVALRRDLNDPNLAFYLAQIGRMYDWPYYGVLGKTAPPDLPARFALVREAQRLLPERLPHTGVIATIDLPLRDGIHLSTPSLKRVGRRFANLVLRSEYARADQPGTPALDSVKFNQNAQRIVLTFRNVGRGWKPGERLSGFSLRSGDDRPVNALFAAEIDPVAPARIILSFQGPLPEDVRLFYGWGATPYCNVVDHADMALPSFGPIPVSKH